MTRAQRNAHRLVWFVLAPLLLGLLAWAIVDRSTYPAQPAIEAPP